MTNNENTNADSTLGSARASRARFGALAETRPISRSANPKQKFAMARAPWPAREARALPSPAKPK